MAFVFSLMPFEPPVAAALNHLLEAEPWARERLIPFSAVALELRLPLLPPLRLAVTGEGRLRPAGQAELEAKTEVLKGIKIELKK